MRDYSEQLALIEILQDRQVTENLLKYFAQFSIDVSVKSFDKKPVIPDILEGKNVPLTIHKFILDQLLVLTDKPIDIQGTSNDNDSVLSCMSHSNYKRYGIHLSIITHYNIIYMT